MWYEQHVRRFLRPLPLVGALVCAIVAGTATPMLHASSSARAAVGPAPGVPPGNELLEERAVPATTPFNSKGVYLKTRFRNGATYYFVASGTGVLPVGRQIDAIYCFKADPPTGGCPPAWEMGVIPGLSLLWYFGTTFDSYSGTRGYGWLPDNGYLKYQPTHRYVYKMKAPHEGRVMVGGPGIGDPSENKGAFKLEVYGPPPKTDHVKFTIQIDLADEPMLIHVRDASKATPLRGRIVVNAFNVVVVADGKPGHKPASEPGKFGSPFIHEHDIPNPNRGFPPASVGTFTVTKATLDASPSQRELTLELVGGDVERPKTCGKAGTAKLVIVDGDPASGGENLVVSRDSYSIEWTSGTCQTFNHTFTNANIKRETERLRISIACYSPKRSYTPEVC